jgi:hypothetical protein
MQLPAGAGVHAHVSPAPHETPKLRSVHSSVTDANSSAATVFQVDKSLDRGAVFIYESSPDKVVMGDENAMHSRGYSRRHRHAR